MTDINQTVAKIANEIVDASEHAGGGALTTTDFKKIYVENLPEGLDEKLMNTAAKYHCDVTEAVSEATAQMGIPLMKDDSSIASTSMQVKACGSNFSSVVHRQKTIRNVQTGEESERYGYVVPKYTLSGAKASAAQMKKMRERAASAAEAALK